MPSGYTIFFLLGREFVHKIPKFKDVQVQDKTSFVYLFRNSIISLAGRQQNAIDAGTAIQRLTLDFVHIPFQLICLIHS